MPGNVERALLRFRHKRPRRREDAPHAWQKPRYGQKIQWTPDIDTSPLLDKAGKQRVEEVIGVFLFYAQAIDNTMLPALSSIASRQATASEDTNIAIDKFLNYAASHPDAEIRFSASDMCLHVETDASYLSETKARSRFSGYHYLSAHPSDDPTKDPAPPINRPLLILSNILKEIVSSASEAELAGTFHNSKEACPLRICLDELGHPQPPTVIVTDNSTASGIANNTIKQRRSKAIDMGYYWIRDRVRQKQFNVLWRKGESNWGDYPSKHHPGKHHRINQPSYLHVPANYYDCLQDAPDSPTAVIPTEKMNESPDESIRLTTDSTTLRASPSW
jgi:hypothetical protein